MNKTNNISEILLGGQGKREFFTGKPMSCMHEFYLSGTIESAENYIDWLDVIRHAGEHDIVKIYINSYGGDLFTAIQMMRALSECRGTVITSVEGACMSAATLVFLGGHSFEVSAHSMFMFHDYSGGVFGKGGEMLDQLRHERSWSEKLLMDMYEDFLTPDEIVSMINNKDIWMDGEEVLKRLQAKVDKIEAEEAAKEARGELQLEDEEE